MGGCDSAIISCPPGWPVWLGHRKAQSNCDVKRQSARGCAPCLLTSLHSYYRSRNKSGVGVPSSNVAIEDEVARCRLEGMSLC